jgi:polysaccharide deacetylase family protein (PEP-CTERM system associated)
LNVLTFDIEEWFHIRFDHEFLDDSKLINSFEMRLDQNMKIILDLLDEYNQKATFFCLGWVARRYPHVVKEIDSRGHEIGCHSDVHKLLYNFSLDQFESDLLNAIDSIESIIDKKVEIYRAPAFSITSKNTWVFDVLFKHGIKVDCSVFPAKRDFGGFPDFHSSKPSIIETSDNNLLKEFPINLYKTKFKDLVFSGGGYFRLLPYFIIKNMMNKSDYVMTYFHPRDFDKDQPIMKGLSMSRRFKSYYGINSTRKKLKKLLKDYDFMCVTDAVNLIKWDEVYVYKL